jgi:exopolyphosphatase/guanosine-5'-triphosphate,3'-diphosphate pyrophosphatase
MTSGPAAGPGGGPAAGTIVPRWEWRTWGDAFGAADERFDALAPEREEESDELYLLARGRDVSAKVRGGLLDVKLLETVDNGLEQWKPVLKAAEPLTPADVAFVLETLGVVAPPFDRDEYTIAHVIEHLAGPSPEVEAVAVRKSRAHYTIDGCMAERSRVRAAGKTISTVALEAEDPILVHNTVASLGLASRRNVSFPNELKALGGFDARRYAVLDVGTNSVKFHLGERAADGTWTTVDDRAEVTRLGEGQKENGPLGREPIERTVEAIAGMADEARRQGVEAIAAVGTAGIRMAPNRDELIDEARDRAGVEVEVISGDEEARLAYLAVTAGLALGAGPVVVFDTGGGSSQFTFGDGRQVQERFSVNVGAARFTETFGLDGPVDEATLASAADAIAADLVRLDGRPAPGELVGMGGAVTNLAAVKHGLADYDPDVVQGSVLELAEIERQIDLYASRTANERRSIDGLQPKRAEVILAGACIVRTVLVKLGSSSLVVSDRGLRHGLLVERFG